MNPRGALEDRGRSRPGEAGPEAPGWHCVRARVRREAVAAEHLRRIGGVEVFAPRIRYRKGTLRGPVWFEEALFPGYLFAAFAWESALRRARYAPGVTGFVEFSGRAALVEDEEIGRLRRAVGPGNLKVFEDPLRAGDRALVLEGPLRGLEVLVQAVFPAADRVRALFEFLGQTAGLTIERAALERVPPPPAAPGEGSRR